MGVAVSVMSGSVGVSVSVAAEAVVSTVSVAGALVAPVVSPSVVAIGALSRIVGRRVFLVVLPLQARVALWFPGRGAAASSR